MNWDEIIKAEKPPGDRVWRLAKNGRTAECTVTPHPLGREVWIKADGKLVKSHVCRSVTEMLDEIESGKQAFLAKGWEEPTDDVPPR